MTKYFFLNFILVVGLSVVFQLPAQASPQPAPAGGPIEKFAAFDDANNSDLSANSFQAVLDALYGENADPDTLMDYGRLSEEGGRVLRSYLSGLQRIPVTQLNRNEQLAYWLNFYNAASLNFVLNEFKRLSKRNSASGSSRFRQSNDMKVKRFFLDEDGPWTQPHYEIEGEQLSVNDIEHRILLAHWDDPRVIYGLYCPAKSCPAMPQKAFTGPRVWIQLDAAAKAYVGRKEGAKVSRGDLEVSSLYRLHRDRFPDDAAIIAHLKKVGGPEMESELYGITQVDDDDFNWRLGGTPPPAGWSMPSRGVSNRGAGFGANPYE